MAGSNQSGGTFQDIRPINLVVMVRFKPPGALNTAAATGLLGGITGAVEGAVSSLESAMDNIPGLNMFIKEDKTKSPSEIKYKYYEDYSNWDKALDKIKNDLSDINDKSDSISFEFSSADTDGRKKDAKELYTKIKSKITSWSSYTTWIHFVGLGQGVNVSNECTSLLAQDGGFKSNPKWLVKSVIGVASPHYKNEHVVNAESFKGQGGTFSFGNRYDLTSRGLDYFDKNEDLLKMITDSNKNTLSLAVGKIKIRLIQIVSIVLTGLHFSAGPGALDDLNKFDEIKDQIKGMVDDILGFVKKLIDEGTSYVDLSELPDFKKIMDGYDAIPGECIKRLQKFISDLGDQAIDQAKHANMSLGPSDLAKTLNCLCPLFDTIKNSLGVLKPNTKTGEDLAQQIIDKSGIKKVFAPGGEDVRFLPYDEKYTSSIQEAAKKNEPDTSGGLIAKIHDQLAKATESTNDVTQMDKDQKIALAEVISCLSLPLLTSKKEFYTKLIKAVPFNLNEMTKDITAGKAMGVAGGALSSIGIVFPDELNQSVQGADSEMARIKGYFDQNNFKMADKKDSLYLIYNSHNLALEKPHGEILKCIDEQTGYMALKKSQGYDYTSDYTYKLASKEEKDKAMPTQEVQEKEKA